MKTIYACPRGCPNDLDDNGQDLFCATEQEVIPLLEVMADGGDSQ